MHIALFTFSYPNKPPAEAFTPKNSWSPQRKTTIRGAYSQVNQMTDNLLVQSSPRTKDNVQVFELDSKQQRIRPSSLGKHSLRKAPIHQDKTAIARQKPAGSSSNTRRGIPCIRNVTTNTGG